MSSRPSVSVPEQENVVTLNILRDVSVRISKMSENDLPKPRRTENVPSLNANPCCLENRIEGELDIKKQALFGITPSNVIEENDVLDKNYALNCNLLCF